MPGEGQRQLGFDILTALKDGDSHPLRGEVSLNRTAMPGRSRFRGLIHCKLGFTLLRFSSFRLAQ